MRLNSLNGWQRLWLVVMVLIWLAGAVIGPWFAMNQYNPAAFEYDLKLKADFASNACEQHSTAPFSSLREPGYSAQGGGCWYVYTARMFDVKSYGDVRPYTYAAYEANKDQRKWEQYSEFFNAASVVIAIFAALVYFLGFVIAWIRRGFHKPVT